MASLKNSWLWLDLSPHPAADDSSNLVCRPVPCEGRIAEVWLSINTVLTTGGGIVTVHKNAINILSATNVDLQSDLTGGTAESQVLTTANATLKVLTTDTIRVGWTLTTSVAATDALGCLVAIEPSYQ
jgi:hypothetical protein